jgi:hypothetical protein
MRITKPQYWFYKARLLRAVEGYPIYDPPHMSAELRMPKAQALENFDYFMRVRLQRLEILRVWMRRNFRFDLTFEPKSAEWLDRWEQKYGAFLVADAAEEFKVFTSYQPPWVGKYASYNVMFDIGIYVGEYVIAKRPNIHWAMYEGHKIEPASFCSIGYQRPGLAGFAGGGVRDALGVGVTYSTEERQYTDVGSSLRLSDNKIVAFLKDSLYGATLTEEQIATLPWPDLRNERLE